MEKNKKLQIYCLLAATFIIGLIGAVCLHLGIANEYDDSMGHFAADSVFAPAMYFCLAAGPAFGIAAWILFRRNHASDRSLWSSLPARIASGAAAALVAVSVFLEINGATYTAAFIESAGGLITASRALGVLTAGSLLLNAFFSGKGPSKPLLSLLSFAPVLYCAVKILILYFDQSVAVNSPVKFICQLAYVSYMLVFTAQTGLSLGRGQIFARYLFTLCCGVCIGGAASVAFMCLNLAKVSCAAVSAFDFYGLFGMFLYSCVFFALAADVRIRFVPRQTKKNKE